MKDPRLALILVMFVAAATMAARAQTETVLYDFTGAGGYGPESNLTFHDGNLYGMTWNGGAFQGGTVFELSPNGSGGWNETVIHSFCLYCGSDGTYPLYGNVIFDSLGNLYGVAGDVAFELSPVGTSWTETLLDTSFSLGYYPMNGLIMDAAGNLYGTSCSGVFELSPSGGAWAGQTIYPLDIPYPAYGPGPSVAGLAMDADGNIFGAAGSTVFELSPNGDGGWNSTVIHTFFKGEDSVVVGTPVLDNAGNIYGTIMRVSKGSGEQGEVYKLSRKQMGEWEARTLQSWPDESGPMAGVVLDAAGNIYGTTVGGWGSVFELVAPPGGHGSYQEHVLWNFDGYDGSEPLGSLILDGAGNLYGTTLQGVQVGGGVVFEVTGVPVPTATTLTSSPNPSTYGEAVTFTAAVTSVYGALPPNGETVSFMQGKTVLGTGTLSGGSASFSMSTLNVGTVSVSAAYGGDTSFLGSTSNTVKQKVKQPRAN